MFEDLSTAGPLAELGRAIDTGATACARATLDELLADSSMPVMLRDVVLPLQADPGVQPVVRDWLLDQARGWGAGRGPRAVLACVPGDERDFDLICFGLALREFGWRVTYLGPSLPLATVLETAALIAPAQIVVSASEHGRAERAIRELQELADVASLSLIGTGMTADLADAVGAVRLIEDPISAATLTASVVAR